MLLCSLFLFCLLPQSESTGCGNSQLQLSKRMKAFQTTWKINLYIFCLFSINLNLSCKSRKESWEGGGGGSTLRRWRGIVSVSVRGLGPGKPDTHRIWKWAERTHPCVTTRRVGVFVLPDSWYKKKKNRREGEKKQYSYSLCVSVFQFFSSPICPLFWLFLTISLLLQLLLSVLFPLPPEAQLWVYRTTVWRL